MAKITEREMQTKPSKKEIWLSESVIWGHGSLAARIKPSNERFFYFRYFDENGKRVKFPLGPYGRGEGGTLTLSEARQKAVEFAKLHKSGIRNIKEHLEKQTKLKKIESEAKVAQHEAELAAVEAQITVNKLFEHWAQVDLINRKDKGAEVRRMFEKDVLPVIGNIHVTNIKKGHFTEVTDLLLVRGVNRMANMIFSLMRQMFRFAVDRDIIEHDPSANIRKSKIGGKQVEGERVVSEDEIRLLAIKLPKANLVPTSQYAVWLCLSTCCRIGELLRAKWGNIDFEKSTWIIPAENSKNGKSHTIHLSDFSKYYFKELKKITGSSGYCYPNRAGDSHINIKTITRQLGDRQKAEGQKAYSNRSKDMTALILPYGKWTPHDLRRTGATLMVFLGVLPEVAERCLNHAEENSIKRIYQRHSYTTEMQGAWNLLGHHIQSLAPVNIGALEE